MTTYHCRKCQRDHIRITHAVPDEPYSGWQALEDVALALIAAAGLYFVLSIWLAS